MTDATDLEYSYIRHIARAMDAAAPAGAPLFTVHLGAGALTLARYVEATRPASPQLVVEFEPELYRAVVTTLPLAAGNDVRVIFGDARAIAEGVDIASPHIPATRDPEILTATSADWAHAEFTVVDLWDAAVIHRRVASREFYTLVSDRSTAHGVVAVNLLDGHPYEYSRRQAATLMSVFAHVAVVLDADPVDGEGPLGNVLVFASNHPLAIAERPELLGAPLPQLISEHLASWIADARPMTDADGTDSPDPDDPVWD